MNIMNKFALRSLAVNRRRTVITVIGVTLAAALITASMTFASSLRMFLYEDAKAGRGDWHGCFEYISAESLEKLRQTGGISVAACCDIGYAEYDGEGMSVLTPWLCLREFGEGYIEMFGIEPTEGRLPQNSGELLVAEESGCTAKVGDTVTLEVGRRYNIYYGPYMSKTEYPDYFIEGEDTITDKVSRTYTVVGKYDSNGIGGILAYTCLTVPENGTFTETGDISAYVRSHLLPLSICGQLTDLSAELGGKLDFNYDVLRFIGADNGWLGFLIMYAPTVMLAIILTVLAWALIHGAFSVSLPEKTRQLGILASVGATRRQRRRCVYFEGLVTGIIGIPLGMLLGMGIMYAAVRLLGTDVINIIGSSSLPSHGIFAATPAALILAAVMSALAVLLSVAKPARRAAAVSPMDAIRCPAGARGEKADKKKYRLTRRIFGAEGVLARKNLKRVGRKQRPSAAALALSMALLCTGVYLLGYYCDGESRENYDVEFSISPHSMYGMLDPFGNITDPLAVRIPGADGAFADITDGNELISEYSQMRYFRTYADMTDFAIGDLKWSKIGYYRKSDELSDESYNRIWMTVYTMPDAAFDSYAGSIGADPSLFHDAGTPRVIVINYVNDIDSVLYKGKILDESTERLPLIKDTGEKYAEIITETFTKKRPMGIDETADVERINIIASGEVYEALYDGAPEYNSLYMRSDDPAALEREITALYEDSTYSYGCGGNFSPSLSADIGVYNADFYNSQARLIRALVLGFTALVLLICISSVLSTVTSSVDRRRREFAMLRSAGLSPDGLSKMLRLEGLFYFFRAALWGVPVSLVTVYCVYLLTTFNWLTHGFWPALEYFFANGFPWAALAAALVFAALLAAVSVYPAARRLKKGNIIDALRDDSF